MKRSQTQKSFFQNMKSRYDAQQKDLKHKKFLLKTQLTATVILPVFIVVLAIKVIQTFVRIKVRSLFTDQRVSDLPSEPVVREPEKPVPATMTPIEKEIIKPVPYQDNSSI